MVKDATTAAATNPIQAEAEEKSLNMVWKGHVYYLPVSQRDIDLEFLEAAESGQLVAAVKKLIGDDQYARFREDNKTVGELEDFMEKAQELMGGNS